MIGSNLLWFHKSEWLFPCYIAAQPALAADAAPLRYAARLKRNPLACRTNQAMGTVFDLMRWREKQLTMEGEP